MKNKLGIALALVLTLGSISFAQDVKREDRRNDKAAQQQQQKRADDKGLDVARDLRNAIELALKIAGLHP